MGVPVLDSALRVIGEGIKYLNLLRKTSHVRRLRKAVDYGEEFILLFYDLVDEPDAGEKRDIRKRMNYLKKKFFQYNQG